jgi:SAM-dependent methyltransferase
MASTLTGPLGPGAWTTGPVADMFSSYVAASALSAAHELGLLDQLAADGSAALRGSPGDGLDANVVQHIYRALSWAQIVVIEDGGSVKPGPQFDAAYAARGYFYWLVRGCGQLFAVTPELAWEQRRQGNFYERDMRAVAVGSRLIGDAEVERMFDKMIATRPVRKVVDLGCGSAHRLIRIAHDHPGIRGIGIDISGDAVRLASEAVAEAGIGHQISIRHADARRLEPAPEYSDTDTLTCVFMGHDFWPFTDCVRTLRGLQLAFPRAQRLLLCDVARTTEPPRPDATAIFTLGFESVHALMGVYVPTLAEWHEAFRASGWNCEGVYPTEAPPNGFLFELTPAGPAETP